MNKIIKFNEIKDVAAKLKKKSKKIVFTNGCFDIFHAGHAYYLNEAKKLGDVLIVGINSDESVKRLKGDKRPIIRQNDRAYLISSLAPVDYVIIFEEDTPYNLIKEIKPDLLVKGSDYKHKDIVGKDIVESNGGKVALIDYLGGRSTSGIIEKIKKL